ncbi:hypothetical protein K3495_g3935 [Podosphaera aphanis]|nr:hypothetical protein K3495_g3935 [Podosphaera aphanis]
MSSYKSAATIRLMSQRLANPRRVATNFSTSTVQFKKATDAVKDTVKGIDKAISSTIADGLEKGQNVAKKARDMANLSSDEAKSEVKGKADELAGEAKSKKEEIKKKI